MDWTMIGALGEVVGAGVVAVTLIYLARQVRLSNRAAQGEAWRALATKWADIITGQSSDPEFRRAMVKIMREGATPDDLSVDERVVIAVWYSSFLTLYEQAFREVSLGILPREALESLGENQYYDLPYFGAAWSVLRENHSKEFKAFVERRHGVPPPS